MEKHSPQKASPAVSNVWFALLTETFDFHLPTRAQWRASFQAAERAPAQHFLLQLAGEAQQGTKADQLALYKAAHAVLPLHGPHLSVLTRLLVRARPVPLEWADVLLGALNESPAHGTPLTAEILEALREIADVSPAFIHERIRLRNILNQLLALGFQPGWLKACSQKHSDGTMKNSL